jgi:uncharacterized protein
MAIDRPGALPRRALLGAALAAATAGGPGVAAAARRARQAHLAAAWDQGAAHAVGLFASDAEALHVVAHAEVPTRAHGLLPMAGGWLLAVARRPGDWLLRWHPAHDRRQWAWAESGRVFTGHATLSADGDRLFTGETDTDTGAGLVGVRDPRSLAKRAEWPTHGLDPHALLAERGALWVANGGIPTWAETGRQRRDMHRMDSSLVNLHPDTGALLGQWRVHDRRLSLRHLARHRDLVGIALQAEHDDPADRSAAPLLAVFDGRSVDCIPLPPGDRLLGYAGDIVAQADGFIVSAPRAHCARPWTPGVGWRSAIGWGSACALAGSADATWLAGRAGGARLTWDGVGQRVLPPDLRVDNHWVPWSA